MSVERAATPEQETRFRFGANWARFLATLNDERIQQSQKALSDMLEATSLEGKSFLDIGSGSGLSSLSAMRLGASRVHSFDYDPESVACTHELKQRFFPAASHWAVESGDVLNEDYMESLGRWDVVYSWGVLHHTGGMWRALAHAAECVAPGGTLFVAIYNDQGWASRYWKRIKQFYNRNVFTRWITLAIFVPYFVGRGLLGDLVRGTDPRRRYREYVHQRGMSVVFDWVDWLGGYPFEVAKPESIFEFYKQRGFVLQRMSTCGGSLGCNEFVFRKQDSSGWQSPGSRPSPSSHSTE